MFILIEGDNLNKYQQAMLDSINIIINEKLKSLPYNYCLDGIVTVVNNDSTYDVTINEEVFTMKALNETSYLTNDLVFVLVKNGDVSQKYILCKRP